MVYAANLAKVAPVRSRERDAGRDADEHLDGYGYGYGDEYRRAGYGDCYGHANVTSALRHADQDGYPTAERDSSPELRFQERRIRAGP